MAAVQVRKQTEGNTQITKEELRKLERGIAGRAPVAEFRAPIEQLTESGEPRRADGVAARRTTKQTKHPKHQRLVQGEADEASSFERQTSDLGPDRMRQLTIEVGSSPARAPLADIVKRIRRWQGTCRSRRTWGTGRRGQ